MIAICLLVIICTDKLQSILEEQVFSPTLIWIVVKVDQIWKYNHWRMQYHTLKQAEYSIYILFARSCMWSMHDGELCISMYKGVTYVQSGACSLPPNVIVKGIVQRNLRGVEYRHKQSVLMNYNTGFFPDLKALISWKAWNLFQHLNNNWIELSNWVRKILQTVGSVQWEISLATVQHPFCTVSSYSGVW